MLQGNRIQRQQQARLDLYLAGHNVLLLIISPLEFASRCLSLLLCFSQLLRQACIRCRYSGLQLLVTGHSGSEVNNPI